MDLVDLHQASPVRMPRTLTKKKSAFKFVLQEKTCTMPGYSTGTRGIAEMTMGLTEVSPEVLPPAVAGLAWMLGSHGDARRRRGPPDGYP
jgi:hypothetical protein